MQPVISYGVSGARWRRSYRYVIAAVIVVTCAILARPYFIGKFETLNAQRACTTSSGPALVFNGDPNVVDKLWGQDGITIGTIRSYDTLAGMPADYHYAYAQQSAWKRLAQMSGRTASGATVFAGRHSTGGAERLVVVEFQKRQLGVGRAEFVVTVLKPHSLFGQGQVLSSRVIDTAADELYPLGYADMIEGNLQLFCGDVSTAVLTDFTIPFRLGGRDGWIDGTVDDDRVSLRVRDQDKWRALRSAP